MPVSYTRHSRELWSDFARLVLEASYEATFSAAIANRANRGNGVLYLTLLGGGAFGNHDDWIFAAIERSLGLFAEVGLDVVIVRYGNSRPRVQGLIRSR